MKMKTNPSGTTYVYVRISTQEQNYARQLVTMKEIGILDDCVFMDKTVQQGFQQAEV